MERRTTINHRAKIRKDKEGKPRFISGYAAVFYREATPATEYVLYDDFIERIQPGTFSRAIKEGHDARALFNHNSEALLGRVANNTVKLTEDEIGLRFDIPVNMEDVDHQRVITKIQRGDLTGCSFAFSNAAATWEDRTDGAKTVSIRNITDVDLHDVGPVTYPAYEATEVGLRTCVESRDALIEARSALKTHWQALESKRRSQAVDIDARFSELVN